VPCSCAGSQDSALQVLSFLTHSHACFAGEHQDKAPAVAL